MKKLFCIIIFIFSVFTIFAQSFNHGHIKQNSYFEVIPYQEILGLPVVQVVINGKTYNFFFDTGAMLTISDRVYRELNPQVIGHREIGSISGERKNMRIVQIPEIHIQGITFKNSRGVVLNEEAREFYECIGIDGFVGSNMLRNSIVNIDGQSKHIIITNNIKKLSTEKREYQKMYLYGQQSRPYIIITMQKGENKIHEKVIIDTGLKGFFKMNLSNARYYDERYDIVEIIDESEGAFTYGIHGTAPKQRHCLLHISELVVGETSFNNLITTTINIDSSIGAELIKYGTIIMDFKRKRFYFEPFDNINSDNLSNKPTTFSFSVQNNKLVVGIIWDKTLESQINIGDEILSINDINIESWDLCQLYLLNNIRFSENNNVELRDINNGKIKRVDLKRLQ